jgi:hypothetical protein
MEIGGRMSKPKNGEKLTISEKFELAVQGGLQLIPYGIGASLSAIYYGAKQEKRFKRIEAFYKEISQDIEILKEGEQKHIKDKLSSLNDNDQAALVAILEELNEKIEREYIRPKIDYFKQYLISTLKDPINGNNFDERRFFLDCLALISLFECEVLSSIYKQNHSVEVVSFRREGVDEYAIVGSINRLKNYGFLEFSEDRYVAEKPLNNIVRLTSFGRKFCDFCLSSSER